MQIKACKKVFNSHQALIGGHRASHKKVKGCFTMTILLTMMISLHVKSFFRRRQSPIQPLLQFEQNIPTIILVGSSSSSKRRIYIRSSRSSVPFAIQFSLPAGQALGVHKRCHWITSNAPDSSFYPCKVSRKFGTN